MNSLHGKILQLCSAFSVTVTFSLVFFLTQSLVLSYISIAFLPEQRSNYPWQFLLTEPGAHQEKSIRYRNMRNFKRFSSRLCG